MSKLLVLAVVSVLLGGALAQLYAQPTSSEPLRAGLNGVGVPSCVSCPRPQYSREALESKYEGDVYLVGVIGLDGRATRLKVLDPGLGIGRRALEAVKAWRFKPALGPDGQPVAVITTIDVRFNLPPEHR
jgi:TonB family protein